MWCNPLALGSASDAIQLEWIGSYAPSTVVSDQTMGVSPAHFRTSPPKNSNADWWTNSGGSNEGVDMFILTYPASGCIVDVTLDCRMVESEAPTAGDNGAGLTLGQVYGDYLDGIGTAILAPVGLVVLA